MSLANELAPTGTLRVAINLGNSVLAHADAGEKLRGVTVELGLALADRIAVPAEFLAYPSGGQVVRSLVADQWDLAFLANEPERAVSIEFMPPYVLIEGTYMTRRDSGLDCIADVDQPDQTIAVGDGAAYHLILARLLRQAKIVTATTSAAAIDLFLQGGASAAAGVRQTLMAAAERTPGVQVLPDSFSCIEQAMAVPKGRSREACDFVREFCAEQKANRFIHDALERSGQGSVAVI